MFAALPTLSRRTTVAGLLVAAGLAGLAMPLAGQEAAQRPMTFLDMQQMRQAGSPTPSPDGKWLLYTLSDAQLEGGERSRPTSTWSPCSRA